MHKLKTVVAAAAVAGAVVAGTATTAEAAIKYHRYNSYVECVGGYVSWINSHPNAQFSGGICFYDAKSYWFVTK